MEKIINGKLYSTDTAKKIFEYNNGYGKNDFEWCQEYLYKKKTGEFFLYGRGGGLSRWAECTPYGKMSGENIMPMTLESAKEWAEENWMPVDTYVSIFGEVEE